MEVKLCRPCGEIKPATEFAVRTRSSDGRGAKCRSCKKEYDKRFKPASQRRGIEAHGISYEQYLEIWYSQNGACAICKDDFPAPDLNEDRKTEIDHDHSCCPGPVSCGRCVRGLLCGKCNKGLGLLNTVEKLQAAINYLHL